VRDGSLVIKQKDLEEIFDPVIDRIVMLIIEQVEAVAELPGDNKVSAILLVGGFGSSEYLRRKIEGNPMWEGTDVIQPVNAYAWRSHSMSRLADATVTGVAGQR
jgi:tRNA A37 threonylcarbamoyltransferase TsaD